jgi:DNA-binding MarR family transcriptional regulator
MPDDPPGFELPLLLIGSFRGVIEAMHGRLARQGHPQARPIHGFALQALGPEGAKVAEVARRLGVSKQAAAKTVASLEVLGYAERVPHPSDGRAALVRRTSWGNELLDLSASALDEIRAAWAGSLGQARLRELEGDLATMAGDAGTRANFEDVPGWLR